MAASGNVLIMAFVGGVGHFFGPIIGAVLVSFLQSALSSYTQAWLLYFGLFFVVMILFAPGGIASLIARARAAAAPSAAGVVAPELSAGGLGAGGAAGRVRWPGRDDLSPGVGGGAGGDLLAVRVAGGAGAARPWVLAAGVFVVGLALFLPALRLVRRAWAAVNTALQAAELQS